MISYYLKISKPKFGVNLNIYDMEKSTSQQFYLFFRFGFESLFEGLRPLTFTFSETGQITIAIHIQLDGQVSRAKYTYTTITRFGVSLMTKVLGAEKPFLI